MKKFLKEVVFIFSFSLEADFVGFLCKGYAFSKNSLVLLQTLDQICCFRLQFNF